MYIFFTDAIEVIWSIQCTSIIVKALHLQVTWLQVTFLLFYFIIPPNMTDTLLHKTIINANKYILETNIIKKSNNKLFYKTITLYGHNYT